jgi:acetyl esterase/lipase
VFLLHGGADRVVPTSSSVAMYDALRAAGVEADLHIFSGQNHGFDHVDVFREVAMREAGLFIRRMVSEREDIARRILDQSMFAKAAAEAAAGGVR